MAVGIAYALRAKGLAEQRVFVLTGGTRRTRGRTGRRSSTSAAGLSNLTLVAIDNRSSSIKIDPIGDKLMAFGWDAVAVDGRNHDELRGASERRSDGPTAVVAVVRSWPCVTQPAAPSPSSFATTSERRSCSLPQASRSRASIRRVHSNGRATYLRTSVSVNSTERALAPGGLTKVRTGPALTVIAVGPMLDRTLAALDGINGTVLYATTALPLDAAALAAEPRARSARRRDPRARAGASRRLKP